MIPLQVKHPKETLLHHVEEISLSVPSSIVYNNHDMTAILTTTCMKLEGIILSEINQIEKGKYLIIVFIYETKR